jgi:phosphomethylpyrimidine synthase
MKITQDLRAEVLAMGDNERAALEGMAAKGMAEKSKEFLDKGAQLYLPAAE